MDQVLVDMKSTVEELVPGGWDSREFFLSADYERHILSGLFLRLKPMPDFHLMREFLLTREHKFVSNVGQTLPHYVGTDKHRWLQLNLEEKPILHGPNNRKGKATVADHFIETTGQIPILIDDDKYTCDLWTNVGGIAILHTSAKDSIEKYHSLVGTSGLSRFH